MTSASGDSRAYVERTRAWLKAGVCAALLFALNFFICHEFFWTEYTDRVDSADAMYIANSRYRLDHWRDSSWWPIWYNGIPAHDAYPPLLHSTVALVAAIEHVSAARAFHESAAVIYALAPVGLFLMAWRLFRSIGIALTAALTFSLISPSTLLIPWMRANAGGWLGPWRLCVLGAYGDAPHMLAFALIPFAVIALDAALTKRTPIRALAAAVLMAAVMLTNWIGALALACTAASYLAAFANVRADLRKWALAACIGGSAYVLASPWIPPSTLRLVGANTMVTGGGFHTRDLHLLALRLLLLAAIFGLAKIFLIRRRVRAETQFAFYLLFLPGAFPLLADWGVAFVPLPHRYVWEMDLAICLFAAAMAASIWKKLPRWAMYLILAAALATVSQVRAYRRYSAALIRPIDMSATVEYRVAEWLKEHYPNYRVFAIGSVAYWMNNFSDQPQASGGFEYGTPSARNHHLLDLVSQTDSAAQTLLWLRAFGADLAVVGGPHSRAPYRVFSHPERFDRIATKVWGEGDDGIYLIPRRSRSLAQVVPREALADPTAYVAALEDPSLPTASFSWLTNESALIDANMAPGYVLSVQISYNPGWRALVNGLSRKIESDSLGLMRIDPGCTGACSVKVIYDGGREATITRISALVVLFVYLGFSRSSIRTLPC